MKSTIMHPILLSTLPLTMMLPFLFSLTYIFNDSCICSVLYNHLSLLLLTLDFFFRCNTWLNYRQSYLHFEDIGSFFELLTEDVMCVVIRPLPVCDFSLWTVSLCFVQPVGVMGVRGVRYVLVVQFVCLFFSPSFAAVHCVSKLQYLWQIDFFIVVFSCPKGNQRSFFFSLSLSLKSFIMQNLYRDFSGLFLFHFTEKHQLKCPSLFESESMVAMWYETQHDMLGWINKRVR